MSSRASTRCLAIAALASVVTACGVTAESQPKTITRSDVPFGLAQQHRTTPTTAPIGEHPYVVYFVSGDRLVPMTRSARAVLTPGAILRELVQGPDQSAPEADLRTLLAPEVTVGRVSVDQGTATVWLGDGGILRSGTAQQALGIAQFVYTATAIPGVERVRFRVGGQPAEVPRGDGTLSSRAVDRSDYPSVAP